MCIRDRVHGLVRFAKVLTALAVADNHILHAAGLELSLIHISLCSSDPAERFIIMTNVFDHWQAQKPALRAALEELTDPAGAAERVRDVYKRQQSGTV